MCEIFQYKKHCFCRIFSTKILNVKELVFSAGFGRCEVGVGSWEVLVGSWELKKKSLEEKEMVVGSGEMR